MKYEEFCERIRQCYVDEDRRALYDEMTKPMGVEEIKTHLSTHWTTVISVIEALNKHEQWDSLAGTIQTLTRQQGFVVDWKEAPRDNEGGLPDSVAMFWYWDVGGIKEPFYSAIATIPRPTPKYREMTVEEMIDALALVYKNTSETMNLKWIATEMAKGRTLPDLCAAAGIPAKIEVKE